MPSGGCRPSGSTSWRPRARIAWCTVLLPVRAGAIAEGRLSAISPGLSRLHGDLDDLGEDRRGVLAQPRDGRAVERVAAEQDAFTDAEVVDPPDVGGRAQPVEAGRIAARHDAQRQSEPRLTAVGDVGELADVAVVGHDAVATGEVGADPVDVDVRQRPRQRSTASGTSSGMIPSRRSPSSTIRSTPCTRVGADGGPAESRSTISISVLQLVSAAITHPLHLAREHGPRISHRRRVDAVGVEPFDVVDARVAEPATRAGRPAACVRGQGAHASPLVTAVTETPGRGGLPHQLPRFVLEPEPEIDLDPRRGHRATAGSGPSGAWGTLWNTMSSSVSVGRAEGVGGRDAEDGSSYPAIAPRRSRRRSCSPSG